MGRNETIEVLKEYIEMLISKINTKERVNLLKHTEKTAIVKDLEGLVTKSSESDKNDPKFKEILIDEVIPYLNSFVKFDDNVVSMQKNMDILKNLYKIAGSISLKHFIIYYEWDWDSKFLEPRLDILSGYCHYLEKLVLDEGFLNVIAELPSGYRQI